MIVPPSGPVAGELEATACIVMVAAAWVLAAWLVVWVLAAVPRLIRLGGLMYAALCIGSGVWAAMFDAWWILWASVGALPVMLVLGWLIRWRLVRSAGAGKP